MNRNDLINSKGMIDIRYNNHNRKTMSLSVRDIAYLLDIPEDGVKDLIRENAFPIILRDGGVRIPARDFYDWYTYVCMVGAA